MMVNFGELLNQLQDELPIFPKEIFESKIRHDRFEYFNMDLTVLLYKNCYPPTWSEDVFEKILLQTENFKKYKD